MEIGSTITEINLENGVYNIYVKDESVELFDDSNAINGIVLNAGELFQNWIVSGKFYAKSLSNVDGVSQISFFKMSSIENNEGGGTSMENVTSSWESVFSSSTGTGAAIVIGTAYTDITGLIGSFIQTSQGPSPITYDPIKNRFHCSSNTSDYYSFSFIWRLSGTVGSSVNQTSEFLIEIRRGDGVTVLPAKRVFSKFSGGAVTLTNEAVADIKIRVFAGGTDPFQDNVTATGGFKVFVRKLSGNDLTLNFNDTTSPKIANTFLFVR